jgi:hypothetical protein
MESIKGGKADLSKLRWTRQQIAAAVVPERRSLIRDRSKRLSFCDPGSRFAWPG